VTARALVSPRLLVLLVLRFTYVKQYGKSQQHSKRNIVTLVYLTYTHIYVAGK